MKPIQFCCREILPFGPEHVAEQILDVTKWLDFHGYGPLPGIKQAAFEVRIPEIVGSKIRVVNADGSSHVEEIVKWQPKRRLQVKMHDFSPPVSRLASHFVETWEFEETDDSTNVARSFELYAKSQLTRLALVPISWFLKKAISRHLAEMKRDTVDYKE